MARKDRRVRPVGPEIDEVAETRKALREQKEGPNCKMCGVREINFTYRSAEDGTTIDEEAILQASVYAMVDLLGETQDELLSGGGAHMTRIRAKTLHALVCMWLARQYGEQP